MDATALRWVLAVIGLIVVVGIYLYSVYQSKLRRRAAIKTFTNEEIESGFIEDESLRNEIQTINAMLKDDLSGDEISQIKINPGMETKSTQPVDNTQQFKLPQEVQKLAPLQHISHVLKPIDNHLLSAEELRNAFSHSGFELDQAFHFHLEEEADLHFRVFNLTASGSFEGISDDSFTTHGMVCCIHIPECEYPLGSYEAMLKKVDELVRILDLKVYSHDFELLTLQHVTDIRRQLLEADSSRDQGS
ncbi:MAG: hypothetical protein H8E21_12725 [Gammaproteobacteria bacterium]|nr:hypothetical protein [Gammaproteobacteria bacterium]MBL6999853.1 hypothetical protein [Gammaproteobacteria bacterium]